MKKILLSLFVGLIGFISFGYCINYSNDGRATYSSSQTFTFNESDLVCAKATVTNRELSIVISNNSYTIPAGSMSCFYGVDNLTFNYNNTNLELYVYQNFIDSVSCPVCPTCPNPYTSLECQELYNLIPIDSVDSAYCENNNLCPVYTGEISTGYSTLFINDIRHESMPFIYVNIPEEFNWDYSTGINDFTIDIEGYNVDTEYIDGIIRIQNYKPSSEDFTNLVGLLAPYTKYLVFLLFVFVLWAWIKKPFKSKKL